MSAREPSHDVPAYLFGRSAETLLVLLGILGGLGVVMPAQRVAAPPADAARLYINPNSATAHELMLLPGIGPTRAEHVIAYRAAAVARPAFSRPEDLDAVRTIGPVTVAEMTPFLRFDAAKHESEVEP